MNIERLTQFKFVVLAGGVGGAKLVDGLSQVLDPENLTIIANTGDDFQHLGLTICPDIDTIMYTLGGQANRDTGWGRVKESWRTHEEVGRLKGPTWFKLGDLDLATHLVRTDLLNKGCTLTQATKHLADQFSVPNALLPMTDHPAPTMIECDQGLLPFQNWFVELAWQPAVRRIVLPDDIKATPEVLIALEEADVVVIAPSNPFVSIDPILNVYPIRELVSDLPDLVIAVSPIIAGKAVKGPAAKMMSELGLEPAAPAVASYYDALLDVFVFDILDNNDWSLQDLHLYQTNTLMKDGQDRRTLAAEIVALASGLIGS
jgi:LPPG:FO 2-phospho-L-lactate transferase